MRNEFHDTQRHILDTGRTIMLGKGFAAVGLNEILTTAGVPKGSFYHYFKSKEQFGNALLEDYFDEYLAHMDALLQADGSPASERLLRYFEQWLKAQTCDDIQAKCLVVKLSAEVTDLSETMRATLQRGTDQAVARLAKGIAEGIADGSLSASLDAEDVAQELYQLWLGSTLLSKVNRDDQALRVALTATRQRLGLTRPDHH